MNTENKFFKNNFKIELTKEQLDIFNDGYAQFTGNVNYYGLPFILREEITDEETSYNYIIIPEINEIFKKYFDKQLRNEPFN
jgi:hypothetical protein